MIDFLKKNTESNYKIQVINIDKTLQQKDIHY